MLTKDDKKYLDKLFDKKIRSINKRFYAVDKRKVNLNLADKIDKFRKKWILPYGVVINHEHRIEKLEDKVFSISA